MILSIDYGSRYVGLAATDHEGRIPFRYGVIDQKKQDIWEGIHDAIAKERIQKIIVGLPLNLEGEETAQTRETQVFIDKLIAKVTPILVESVDETLTSVEAGRMIKAEGASSHLEHAEAARIMLEDYLVSSKR